MSGDRQGEPSWKSRFPFDRLFGAHAGKPSVEKMKREGDVAGLIDALDYNRHKDYHRYQDAYSALVEVGAPAVAPLLVLLEQKQDWLRYTVARLLGVIADRRAVEPLVRMLQEPAGSARQAAAAALGRFDDPRAIEALCRALVDEDPTVQILAEKSLENNAAAPAVAPLVRLAHDPKASVHVQTILRLALDRAAQAVATEDLRAVVRLNDSYVMIFTQVESSCAFTSYNVTNEERDFTQIKQMARQELIRRGLEA